MIVRKYTSKTIQDAISQIRADLGEHATIVATRSVKSGLLSSHLEVTAALDPVVPRSVIATQSKPLDKTSQTSTTQPTFATGRAAGGSWDRERRELDRLLAPLREELRALRREIQSAREQPQPVASDLQLNGLRYVAIDQPNDEANGNLARTGAIEAIRRKLERSGMIPEHIAQILRKTAERLSSSAPEAFAQAEPIAQELIMAPLRVAAPIETEARGAVAIVGPTGVGKTTLIAKIVTRAALVHERNAALVTCDSDRMGGHRSFEAIAETVGVPWRAAAHPSELRAALADLSAHDLILVDTPGFGLREIGSLDGWATQLSAAGVATHLLLPADMRAAELGSAVSVFSLLKPQSLSFSRLDCSLGLGGLYDAARLSGLPLMYLSDGARIPDDLHESNALDLSSMILAQDVN